MRLHTLILVALAASQTGCLALATSKSFDSRDVGEQYDHYVDFYADKLETIRTHYGCVEAARYLGSAYGDRAPRQVDRSSRDDLRNEYVLESELLVETCMEEEFPKLKEDFDPRVATTFFATLADLPVNDELQAELERRAKSVGVVEAAGMAKRADEAWAEGRYAQAIALYESAEMRARGQSKATEAEKKAFAEKTAAKKAERARMLVASAKEHAGSAQTEHLALLEYSRAIKLGDKSAQSARDALWKKLRSQATYRVEVDLQGSGPVAEVRKKLEGRSWPTPLTLGASGGATIRASLAPVQVEERTSPGKDSRSKVIGTKMVDNPDHDKLVKVVNAWQRCVNKTRESLAEEPSRGGGVWWGPCHSPCGYGIADDAAAAKCNYEGLNKFERKLAGFRNKLAATPAQVEEKITEPVYFPTTEYVWTASSSLEITTTPAGGSPSTQTVPLRTTRQDASHGAVAEVGLRAKSVTAPPKSAHQGDIAAKADDWIADWIKQDSASHSQQLKGQGLRGAVLYFVLTGRSDDALEATIREETGIPGARWLLRQ